jgi:hypothetical protein
MLTSTMCFQFSMLNMYHPYECQLQGRGLLDALLLQGSEEAGCRMQILGDSEAPITLDSLASARSWGIVQT